jgi:hypothetical protein
MPPARGWCAARDPAVVQAIEYFADKGWSSYKIMTTFSAHGIRLSWYTIATYVNAGADTESRRLKEERERGNALADALMNGRAFEDDPRAVEANRIGRLPPSRTTSWDFAG